MATKHRSSRLDGVQPVGQVVLDGQQVDLAWLDITDSLGRRGRVYAGRCVPAQTDAAPCLVHLPGNGQSVDPDALAWWARRGFAAVSFDWSRFNPPESDSRPVSRWPEEVVGLWGRIDTPEKSVIPSAIEAVDAAISWMRTAERVDTERLGIVGISWGGYLAWMINAANPAVRACVPVFGCGGLFEPNRVAPVRPGISAGLAELWRTRWDPLALGTEQHSPVCFLSATNDFFGHHSVAHRLLDGLAVDHRRSFLPNGDHRISPGQAGLAVGWLRHHLCDGPTVPDEPVVTEDLRVVADDSREVTRAEIWWTPSDGPDHARCWIPGKPPPHSQARQVFGLIHYADGMTLTTPLREMNVDDNSPAVLDPVWPDARAGVTSQHCPDIYAPPVDITPTDNDSARAVWRIPGTDDFVLYFRGLADPRWNTGDFDTIEITVEADRPLPRSAEVRATIWDQTSRTVPIVDGRVRVSRRDLDPDPAANWGTIHGLWLRLVGVGSSVLVGPIIRTADEERHR